MINEDLIQEFEQEHFEEINKNSDNVEFVEVTEQENEEITTSEVQIEENTEKNSVEIVEKNNDNAIMIAESNSLSYVPFDNKLNDENVVQALAETKNNIIDKAKPKINNEKIVEKHAKKLAENADESIKVELEKQELEIKKANADNKATRKEINNRLYALKQEEKRLKKDQKHLNSMQKLEHKRENEHTYWEAHKSVLSVYGMKEGGFRPFCEIILALDGIKGFINGLGKVSTAIVSAMKWVILIGLVLLILNIIPVTREWLNSMLGFI